MKTALTVVAVFTVLIVNSPVMASPWEFNELQVSMDAPDEVTTGDEFNISVNITSPDTGVMTVQPLLALQMEPDLCRIVGDNPVFPWTFTYEGTPVIYNYSDLYLNGVTPDPGIQWQNIPAGYENGFRFARLTDNLSADWRTGDFTWAYSGDRIKWSYQFSGFRVTEPGTYDFALIINGMWYGTGDPVGYGWMGIAMREIPYLGDRYHPDPIAVSHIVRVTSSIVSAVVDIDPDRINLSNNGNWITAHIELPEGYDPASIRVSTVMLNGLVTAESVPFGLEDHDSDGIPDLMVKFNRNAVQDIIDTSGNITLTVTGELGGGQHFAGEDTVFVK